MKKLFASLALAAAVAPVWAATQTVTLAVPGMTCAACLITVKTALTKVIITAKAPVPICAKRGPGQAPVMAQPNPKIKPP